MKARRETCPVHIPSSMDLIAGLPSRLAAGASCQPGLGFAKAGRSSFPFYF